MTSKTTKTKKPKPPQIDAPAGCTPLGIPVAAAEVLPREAPSPATAELMDASLDEANQDAMASAHAPEVKIEDGTTLVLPNPADAPAPKARRSRRQKAEPTTATRELPPKGPPAETPAWIAGAERGPDMSKATTTYDAAADDAPVEAQATAAEPENQETTMKTAKTKKAAPKKAAAAKPEKPAPKGSLRAAAHDWTAHLEKEGHTTATVATYRRAITTSLGFFGDDATAKDAAARLDGYAKSKTLTHKENGKPKAKPGIDRDIRAVRMCLEWVGAIKNDGAK